MNHGQKLSHLLSMGGLTQEALANRVGVSFASVNAWVNGRAQPRRSALLAIDGLCAELAVGSCLGFEEFFQRPTEAIEAEVGRRQRLTEQQLDELLGGVGDPEAIELLRDGQHDKFLKCLASIVETLPNGAMTEAIVLLDAAKTIDSATCKQVLTYPYVAIWAAVCLRRILGVSPAGSVDDHVAHFSAIAAVAAWKCGVEEFAIRVPVRDGGVVLPSLGRAVLLESDDAESALLTCVDGEMRIATATQMVSVPRQPSNGTYEWEPIRTISATSAGLELTLAIDDVDPYRVQEASLPSAVFAGRLDQLDFKTWKQQVSEAWEILAGNHREYAEGIAVGTRVIVPIEDEVRHANAFYRDGFGAIASTIGASSAWIAQSMLEEFQRTKLNALHSLTTLYTATCDTPGYMSPVGDTPIPFNCLVEGFYSTVACGEFWGARYRSTIGEEQFEAAVNCRLRHIWEESLFHTLGESGELTALGRKMLTAIRLRGGRAKEDIPVVVVELVRNETIDHRLCFRMANVSLDAADIERLANAWATGMSCPVNKSVRRRLVASERSVVGRKRRRKLSELRLAHPEQFEDVVSNEHYLDLVVPGATLADAYAVADRFDEAKQGYIDLIRQDANNIEAWAGLAVVAARSGNDIASTLGRLPEVVAALHQYLHTSHGRTEDPTRLAKWLEPLLLRMDDADFESEYEPGATHAW